MAPLSPEHKLQKILYLIMQSLIIYNWHNRQTFLENHKYIFLIKTKNSCPE